MFLLWVNLATIAIFKAYPEVGDIVMHVTFIPLILHELTGKKKN